MKGGEVFDGLKRAQSLNLILRQSCRKERFQFQRYKKEQDTKIKSYIDFKCTRDSSNLNNIKPG